MPEGHHPPLSRSSNVEQPRIVGLPLRLETRHRSPLHPPSWSWRYRPGVPRTWCSRPARCDRGSGISLFRGAPRRGAAGGWRGVDPNCGARTRSARSPRAFTRRMSPPRRGKGGTLERRSGVVSNKLLQGTRVGGLQRVFRSLPRVQLYPLKTWPPRGEATRAALSGPLRECTDDHRTD